MYKNFSFCFTLEKFFPIILIILCEKEREKEKKNLMFLLIYFFIAFNKSTNSYKSL